MAADPLPLPTVSSSDVKTLRPTYDNLELCLADPVNVYIGRGGIIILNGRRYPPKTSVWANPYKVGRDCEDVEACLKLYRNHLEDLMTKGVISVDDLRTLRGKTLRCWCKTKKTPNAPCHGEVIVDFVKRLT